MLKLELLWRDEDERAISLTHRTIVLLSVTLMVIGETG